MLRADGGNEKLMLAVPAGTCGRASGAEALIEKAQEVILKRNLSARIGVRVTGCHGFCEMEPSVLVQPLDVFYPRLSPDDVEPVIETALAGRVEESLLYRDPASGEAIACQGEIPFFPRPRSRSRPRSRVFVPAQLCHVGLRVPSAGRPACV